MKKEAKDEKMDTRKRRRRSQSKSQRRQTHETNNEEEPRNRQPQEIQGVIDYIVERGEISSTRKGTSELL